MIWIGLVIGFVAGFLLALFVLFLLLH